MSGVFLSTRDTAENKTDKNPCPLRACMQIGRQTIKYIHKFKYRVDCDKCYEENQSKKGS
jgi:hypothetical protein